jgi:hypothetical protein
LHAACNIFDHIDITILFYIGYPAPTRLSLTDERLGDFLGDYLSDYLGDFLGDFEVT